MTVPAHRARSRDRPPEAVRLDFEVVTVGSRAVALLIDLATVEARRWGSGMPPCGRRRGWSSFACRSSRSAGAAEPLLTRRHQRLGDLAAGTIVVRERTGAGAPQPVFFTVPAGMACTATLDTAGLGPEHYATPRRCLVRARSLVPDHRSALATQIASSLAARMAHTPPPADSWPPDQPRFVPPDRGRRRR